MERINTVDIPVHEVIPCTPAWTGYTGEYSKDMQGRNIFPHPRRADYPPLPDRTSEADGATEPPVGF